MTNVDVNIRVTQDGSVNVKKDFEAIGDSAIKAGKKVDDLKAALQRSGNANMSAAVSQLNSVSTAAANTLARVNSIGPAFGRLGTQAASGATQARGAMSSVQSVLTGISAAAASTANSIGSAASRMLGFRSAAAGAVGQIGAITPVATAAGVSTANLAAQFNDIGVTAAMSMSPLQIALQQGTQISQVLGPLGAAGAVKALAQAFLATISPVALFTIGTVAGVAAFIQYVNWSKVLVVAMQQIAGAVDWVRSNMDTLSPILSAVGGALLLAFGPAALSAVMSLAAAIGTTLYAAVMGVFTLIITNPITAIFLAVGAAIGFIIQKTIGWRAVIENIIYAWGKVLEILGRIGEFFTGNDWLTNKGIEIQINAEKAAADLVAAGEKMGNSLLTAIKDGAQSLAKSVTEPVEQVAAPRIEEAFVNGAEKAAPVISKNMEGGGKAAAQPIQQAMLSGGSSVANDILNALKAGAMHIIDAANLLDRAIRAQIENLKAQTRALQAAADKNRAEAAAIRKETNGSGAKSKGSSGGGSSSGRSYESGGYNFYTPFQTGGGPTMQAFAKGGQFGVGGSGSGRDQTPVAFRANRGERVTVETTKQQRANDNRNGSAANVNVPVEISNVLDPRGIVDSTTDTEYGRKKIMNMIKLNRNEIRSLLGGY